jgi:hypothetical protein
MATRMLLCRCSVTLVQTVMTVGHGSRLGMCPGESVRGLVDGPSRQVTPCSNGTCSCQKVSVQPVSIRQHNSPIIADSLLSCELHTCPVTTGQQAALQGLLKGCARREWM